MYRYSLAMVALLSVGCASIVSDTTGQVYVQSHPPNALYEIRNHREMVMYRGTTPGMAILKKKKGYFQPGDYAIYVSKDGYTPGIVPIGTRISWWYAGNIIFGGLIGLLIIDPATGAMWHLEENPPQVILHTLKPEQESEQPYIREPEQEKTPPPMRQKLR